MVSAARLVFGLLYLLATGHDGPFDHRDLLGLLAGLASLMCSGVGVTMVVVVVVAVAIRRGWRVALAHGLPLAAVYLAWFAWIGHLGYPPSASPGQTLHFAGTVISSTFAALGHGPVVGALLAALLVGGGAMAWSDASPGRRHKDLAAPLALLVGAVVFALVTGAGRGAPPAGIATAQVAAKSRYLHIIAALSIPALAVAADAVIRRWRFAAPVVLVALLIGVPGNIAVAVQHGDENRATAAFFRPFILTLPRLPVAAVLPRGVHPDIYFDPVMTLGWLRAGVAQGRIPPPPSTVTAPTGPPGHSAWPSNLRSTWRATAWMTASDQAHRSYRGHAHSSPAAIATLTESPRVRSWPQTEPVCPRIDPHRLPGHGARDGAIWRNVVDHRLSAPRPLATF